MPAPSAPQNTSFSPALNRRAGACLDLMKPPPCLNHSMSVLSGMLSLMNIATISTNDEREAREVVHVLGGFRYHAERVVANQRQQQMLFEGDVQPGEAENDERGGGEPMREPLDHLEADHLAS